MLLRRNCEIVNKLHPVGRFYDSHSSEKSLIGGSDPLTPALHWLVGGKSNKGHSTSSRSLYTEVPTVVMHMYRQLGIKIHNAADVGTHVSFLIHTFTWPNANPNPWEHTTHSI